MAKTKEEVKDEGNLCPSCRLKDKKVVMTQREPGVLACPQCNTWIADPKYEETKEQKRKRLEAELAALN